MVGGSSSKTKSSYVEIRAVQETGYDMIAINPRPDVKTIRGLKVFHSLESNNKKIDIIEVFRYSKDLSCIAKPAVAISAKVSWGKIGILINRLRKLPRMLG